MNHNAAPGSLHHTITSYPRTRLYCHPSLWTDEHVRLLDCQLASLRSGSPSILSAVRLCDASEMVKNKAVDKIVASLAGYVTKSSKDEPIERLMRALIPLSWQRSGRGQAPSLERYAYTIAVFARAAA